MSSFVSQPTCAQLMMAVAAGRESGMMDRVQVKSALTFLFAACATRPGLKLTMSEARTVLAADFFDRMHESASYSLLNLAAFKRRPSFPRIDRQLNYFHSERNQPNDPCAKCFPCKEGTKSAAYIDLLELPRVGGLPWRPRAPGLPPPRAPLFADLRYSLTAPLSKRYISVTNAVLHSERVEAGIRKTLRERQEENDPSAVKKLRAQATAYVKEMSATFSMLIARLCGYSLFKILRRVMRRLLVCPAQLELIKRAEQEGLPIVYLPLHKSHLDYILLTWTVWHWDLRLPHIASGDNLNLSGFG
uniref:Uncharacterized protein n=1 Tax=Plectus sambesii TaxID=2011161 RepID=A0A914VUN2_9BILA